ncbi:MAG: hypothetical protein PWQ34_67 [Caldanaerobacter sp.]|jgi:hypothetical protein|uniref:hypothetical protein n=1 Tax=Caldanaerobacter sp. TaxID=2930036 RepID=UPI0024AB1F18|nr:hypothetical protein [Caldanaerobacter sp.]MDI3517920.1 hypothetical protein [Caldanaerobacter sp.]
MFKKIKVILLMAIFILSVALTSVLYAAQNPDFKSYKEVFLPINEKDAKLTITAEEVPDAAGYVYLFSTIKEAKLEEVQAEENVLVNNTPEKKKIGSVDCLAFKVLDKERPVKLKATFLVPDFYSIKNDAAEKSTGPGGTYRVSYSFTCPVASGIETYSLKILLPENYEILTVAAPKSYELGVEGKNRYMLVNMKGKEGKKGLGFAKSVEVDFVIKKENVTKNILIWIASLGIATTFLVFNRKQLAK